IGNFLRDNVIVKSFVGPNRTELYTLVGTPSGRAWGKLPGKDDELRAVAKKEVEEHLARKERDKDLVKKAEPVDTPKDEPVKKTDNKCQYCRKKLTSAGRVRQHEPVCPKNPDRNSPGVKSKPHHEHVEGDDIEKAKHDFEHLNDPVPPVENVEDFMRLLRCSNHGKETEARGDIEFCKECGVSVTRMPDDPDTSVAHPIEELTLPDSLTSNASHTETVEIPIEHLHDEDDVTIRRDIEEHRGTIIKDDEPAPKDDPLMTFRKHVVQMIDVMEKLGHKTAYSVEEVKSLAGHSMTIQMTIVEKAVVQ
ncbi:MAG: hypothetical protein WC375_09995, partial [Methanomassiliicoccales archaeon]